MTIFAKGPFVLITRPALGAEMLDGFVALARRNAGKLTFASWGIGSASHLAMEALMKQAGLSMLHVPFTGAAPASTALIAAQVDVMFLNAGPAEAAARDGRTRILGSGAASRISLLPAVPTLAELGMAIEAANWFGFLGPAALPEEIAARLAAVTNEALAAPQVQESFRTGRPAGQR